MLPKYRDFSTGDFIHLSGLKAETALKYLATASLRLPIDN
jgi:hypothetical protein